MVELVAVTVLPRLFHIAETKLVVKKFRDAAPANDAETTKDKVVIAALDMNRLTAELVQPRSDMD